MNPTNSVNYYNNNAEKYLETTKDFDASYLYNLFLPHLPKGGKILDAGCGSGRDTKYFLEHGYDVTAIDGSEKLASLASQHSGTNVQTMRFQDMVFDNEFDGVWASASLLHVPKIEIEDVLKKIYHSLKKNGVFYASFRYGEEECDEGDRYFNDQTEKSLSDLLNTMGSIEILHMSIPDSLKSRRGFKFVSSVLKKTN